MDRFRCRTPGANETNLCFNGGTCITTNDTERCSCPDGWGPDNVLFHQDNVSSEYALALFAWARACAFAVKPNTLADRLTCADMPQCVLPSNALMGAFIFMSIATALCFAALWSVQKKARGRVRTVLIWAAITVGLVWAQILSLWLEQGTFVSTPILLCIVTMSAAVWAGNIAEVSAYRI